MTRSYRKNRETLNIFKITKPFQRILKRAHYKEEGLFRIIPRNKVPNAGLFYELT
jgi:hypothetical protein